MKDSALSSHKIRIPATMPRPHVYQRYEYLLSPPLERWIGYKNNSSNLVHSMVQSVDADSLSFF